MSEESKEFIVKEILRLLDEKYPIGLYGFLYSYHSDLSKQLQEIEEEIDNAYLNGTTEKLKQVLREYWVFYMRAIQTFKAAGKGSISDSEVRKEMLQGRLM